MSNMQIDAVLAQIRNLSSQIHAPAVGVGATQPTAAQPGSFASLMKQGIEQVNSTQLRASELATAFERGVPGVELPDVMLEMQKANVSFRALAEVRNRFVSVYQEIMSMPI
jgi:flagellar hook-basal body complex protein FliE